MVDAEYELPISASISAGNVHDSKRASNLLSEARFTYSRFHPQYVMADQGYSGGLLNKLIIRQYSAAPIIQANKGHKRLTKQLGETQRTPEWKALYSQHQSVERAFSRLKGQR